MLSHVVTLVALAGPAPEVPETVGAPSDEAASEPAAERLETLERDNAELREESAQLRAEQDATKARLDAIERDNARAREALDKDNAALRREVEAQREAEKKNAENVRSLLPLKARLSAYLDVGFFRVAGDGSGVRPDIGYQRFGEYQGRISDEWVFMGDPLSTAINARGDVADTGPSRAITFDPVGAGDNPTFIVNALTFAPYFSAGDQVSADALVDFLPRNRDVSIEGASALGDYVDIKRAQLRWIAPAKRLDIDVYAGKIDSVFGREYRYQEAPTRVTVTPSLICRYTCGRPVGVSTRLSLLPRRALHFNASLTNGGTVQETFGFANEIDANAFKTITGRVAYNVPVVGDLELGVSGEVGAQDLQPRNDRLHWQYGVDVHFQRRGFELTGEFVQVRLRGQTRPGQQNCGLAPCLRAMGAYGLAGYRVTNWLMPYFRTDWRDALHEGGASFVYVSQLVRFTPGVRFEVGEHLVLKAEYSFNRELGRIPQFRNDVVTSSAVAVF